VRAGGDWPSAQDTRVVAQCPGEQCGAPFGQHRWPSTRNRAGHKVFDLNVKGVFFLVKELVSLLAASATSRRPARIINVGSIDGFRVPPHESYAYPASKAALHR